MAEEAAASDDAIPDPGFPQRLHDAAPVDVERRVEDQRERKPGATAPVTSRWMMKRSSPSNSARNNSAFLRAHRDHAIELLQLLDAHGARQLQRASVVAGEDEAVRLEEIVGAAVVDCRAVWKVARPAVRAQRARQMSELGVVGGDNATLHCRDVVREEGAERVDVTERAARLAAQRGSHRLAVVLQQVEAVAIAECSQHVEGARIAEDADGNDHARARGQRSRKLRHVDVQRVQIDVDEAEPQPVLLQRMNMWSPTKSRGR